MKVLVTGATGFVGQELCRALLASGINFRAVLRRKEKSIPIGCEIVQIGDIGPQTN